MRTFSLQEKQFIQENLHRNPAELMLQAKRYPDLPMAELVQQIQARQKALQKLPTWAANPEAVFPVMLSVEQSSSEKTAAFKAALLSGALAIDITGGFGVDSYFFSKSFDKVLHIEQNKELSEIASYNFKVLQAANVESINLTAEDFLGTFTGKADLIYADPARRGGRDERVHLLQDCEPDILRLLPLLLDKAHAVLLKTSPMLDIDLAITELKHVVKVWVVAVQNECKEVLYLLTPATQAGIERIAVNILPSGEVQQLTFTQEEEAQASVSFADPQEYVYEPNAAILKAGSYKYLAKLYNLNKLHPNSHLYTSGTLVPEFPGRAFRCLSVSRYNKKELLPKLPDKKANITVRNFPESVAEIRKKTGIKEGGNTYLFFTTDKHQKPVVLFCKKV